MSTSCVVKRLVVEPREKVGCEFCQRTIKKVGVMVRTVDEYGRLEELVMFCGVGCGLAYTDTKEPDPDAEEALAC